MRRAVPGMRVRTSIWTTAGATWSKMAAKLAGAPGGWAKGAPETPELGVIRRPSPPGQRMKPPAVAAAATSRPAAAPRMNSLRFSIWSRTSPKSGPVRSDGPGDPSI